MSSQNNTTGPRNMTDNIDTDMIDVTPPLHLHNLIILKYSVPIYGYIVPVLIFLTVITNTLVIAVLLKKNMRTSTNLLLAGMAFSDTLTGVIPLPIFIYFFSMGRYHDFVPYEWCYPYKMLFEVLPIIFHTASIWLTVGLAVQRYICICYSLHARAWCTITNVKRATTIVYIIAVFSQITKFFDFYVVRTPAYSLLTGNLTYTYDSCYIKNQEWAINFMDTYQNLYYSFRIIFIHLVPCLTLFVLTGLLISAMRKSQARRIQLLKQKKRRESRKLKDSNSTTLMLVVVVGMFLLVELPLGIIMTLFQADNTFNLDLFTNEVYALYTSMSNFLILLSYPLNFFIYCGMSRQFRVTFKSLFRGGPIPP